MTAPPPRKSIATCQNKQRHPDELVARAVAMSVLNHPKCQQSHLYVYCCPFCRGWHLTRTTNGIAYKVTRTNPVHTPFRRDDKPRPAIQTLKEKFQEAIAEKEY